MFWDRYWKDLGIASFISLGWNLGFVREFGGAAMEAVTRPVGATGKAAGIRKLTPSQQRQTIRDNTNKLGFVFTYLLSAAGLMGAMSVFADVTSAGVVPKDAGDEDLCAMARGATHDDKVRSMAAVMSMTGDQYAAQQKLHKPVVRESEERLTPYRALPTGTPAVCAKCTAQ